MGTMKERVILRFTPGPLMGPQTNDNTNQSITRRGCSPGCRLGSPGASCSRKKQEGVGLSLEPRPAQTGAIQIQMEIHDNSKRECELENSGEAREEEKLKSLSSCCRLFAVLQSKEWRGKEHRGNSIQ